MSRPTVERSNSKLSRESRVPRSEVAGGGGGGGGGMFRDGHPWEDGGVDGLNDLDVI